MYKTVIIMVSIPAFVALVVGAAIAQQAPNADCKAGTADWGKCVINQQLSRSGQ